MKKVLSLLTTIALTSSTISTVVSCTNSKDSKQEKEIVSAINSINDKVELNYNTDLKVKDDKDLILNTLYKKIQYNIKDINNEKEFSSYIKNIIPSKSSFTPDDSTTNSLIFKVDNINTKKINFIMDKKPIINNVFDLKKEIDKIGDDILRLSYKDDLNVMDNKANIINVLNTRLSYLTKTELSWIKDITSTSTSFVADGKTISKITFKLNDGKNTTSSNPINYVMDKKPIVPADETAQQIANKIKNTEIWMKTSLGGNTSNQYVQKNILFLLKSINSNDISDKSNNLNQLEINAISFPSDGKDLTNNLQDITLTINLNKTTATKIIKVGLNPINSNKMYAPFFDIGQSYKYDLTKIKSSHSLNTIIAAFLEHESAKDKPTADDPVGWSWAGISIDDHPKRKAQYKFLDDYRKVGGKFIISFGGEDGTPGWLSTYNYSVSDLTKSFQYIIDTYQPYGFDFDIEGNVMNDTAGNTNLFKAMENIHAKNPKLKVSYTIAVDPITDKGIINPNFENSFKALLKTNFVPTINCMTMDFNKALTDMSKPIINSLIGIANRLKNESNPAWNIKTLSDAYQHMGVTPMIGMNDSSSEISDFNVMMKVSHFASVNKLPLFSGWSLTRDNGSGPGTGGYNASGMYQTDYQFSDVILDTYGDSNESTKPVSGDLKLSDYAFFKDAIAIKFEGASNVNSYAIYLDNKKISNANAASIGFTYYNNKMTIGKHTMKVVALGAKGSSITSNQIQFDNSEDGILKCALINFDINSIYKNPGDLIYYKGNVVRIKWWKRAGDDFQPFQTVVLGPLSKFRGFSQEFINDFTSGQIPSWYFHLPPEDGQ